MPATCFAPGCANRKTARPEDRLSGISFHLFPSDPSRLQRWLRAIGRDHDCPTRAFLCSRHFKQSDFVDQLSANRRIKPNAVPSIFHRDGGEHQRSHLQRQESQHQSSSTSNFNCKKCLRKFFSLSDVKFHLSKYHHVKEDMHVNYYRKSGLSHMTLPAVECEPHTGKKTQERPILTPDLRATRSTTFVEAADSHSSPVDANVLPRLPGLGIDCPPRAAVVDSGELINLDEHSLGCDTSVDPLFIKPEPVDVSDDDQPDLADLKPEVQIKEEPEQAATTPGTAIKTKFADTPALIIKQEPDQVQDEAGESFIAGPSSSRIPGIFGDVFTDEDLKGDLTSSNLSEAAQNYAGARIRKKGQSDSSISRVSRKRNLAHVSEEESKPELDICDLVSCTLADIASSDRTLRSRNRKQRSPVITDAVEGGKERGIDSIECKPDLASIRECQSDVKRANQGTPRMKSEPERALRVKSEPLNMLNDDEGDIVTQGASEIQAQSANLPRSSTAVPLMASIPVVHRKVVRLSNLPVKLTLLGPASQDVSLGVDSPPAHETLTKSIDYCPEAPVAENPDADSDDEDVETVTVPVTIVRTPREKRNKEVSLERGRLCAHCNRVYNKLDRHLKTFTVMGKKCILCGATYSSPADNNHHFVLDHAGEPFPNEYLRQPTVQTMFITRKLVKRSHNSAELIVAKRSKRRRKRPAKLDRKDLDDGDVQSVRLNMESDDHFGGLNL